MKYRKFIDLDIDIDFDVIKGLNFDDVVSWAQIEIFAAVNGGHVDSNLMFGLLFAARDYKNIRDAISEELKNSDSVDRFVKTDEFIEMLFRASAIGNSRTLWKYTVWSSKNGIGIGNYGGDLDVFRYGMLDLIFEKFPSSVIRFYDLNKTYLHISDLWFISWFSKKIDSLNSKKYGKIIDVVKAEMANQVSLVKFMN